MKVLQYGILIAALATGVSLGGCSSSSRTEVGEHYVSPQVQGETAKINLEEVQKAFWDTKGKDFNTWMGAFEKRVNEIYEGKEVISIDATRKDGKLIVTGYFDTKKQEGYKDGDEKLFSIEQTGEAANNEMPYRVSNSDGRTYYEGHHSFLDNPILQMMIVGHLMGGGMGGWGGRYYTPPARVIVLHDSRDSWRSTPQYSQQQSSNSGFFSRFKSKSGGSGFDSKTSFGNSSFSSDAGAKRRTFGFGSSSSPSASATPEASSSSGWGGRRSSGAGSIFGGGSGFKSRGWGGRRR